MLLYKLIIGHILGDFPLQGDFMSKYKNFNTELVGKQVSIWPLMLTYHAMIQGFIVYFITNMIFFGVVETIVHWLIDYGKMKGYYNFNQDQAFHILCKCLWVGLINVVNN